MRSKTIRNSISLHANPKYLYELLTDPAAHTELICANVTISDQIGAIFEILDTGISGQVLDLVPYSKIVLTWRLDDRWPEGYFSKVTFRLEATESGTLLLFTQTGVPAQDLESVTRAWNTYYWQPLKAKIAHELGAT